LHRVDVSSHIIQREYDRQSIFFDEVHLETRTRVSCPGGRWRRHVEGL